jgi:hypothetical protein
MFLRLGVGAFGESIGDADEGDLGIGPGYRLDRGDVEFRDGAGTDHADTEARGVQGR